MKWFLIILGLYFLYVKLTLEITSDSPTISNLATLPRYINISELLGNTLNVKTETGNNNLTYTPEPSQGKLIKIRFILK